MRGGNGKQTQKKGQSMETAEGRRKKEKGKREKVNGKREMGEGMMKTG